MRYALAIALMLSLSFGLITESFRYQSTARLWEDDYDLMFDPARLPEIEGARLWTSLANFVTGGEHMFSNASVPYILVGGTKNFGSLYPGFVYDRSSSKDPMYTGIDDIYGNPMYGDGFREEIDWELDTLGNQIYQTVTRQTASAYEGESFQDFYVGVGTRMNSLRFGLGFMQENHSTKTTDPSNNYMNYNYWRDVGDTLGFVDTVDFAGDRDWSSTENDIIFSVWMDRDEYMSYGLTARYEMISTNTEELINGFDGAYVYGEDRTDDYTETYSIDSLDTPQSGNRIDLELKLFWNWAEYVQGRFYAGYFMRSVDYGTDAVEYNWSATDQNYYDRDWDTTYTTMWYDGGYSSNGIRVGTKQLFTVSDRLLFGFGFFWSTTSYDDSVSRRDTSVNVHRYDNGDTLQNFEDYTEWTYSSQTFAMLTDGSVNTFTIPVGVEFYVAQPVVFRMGATHSITKNDLTSRTVLTDWQPQEYRYLDQDDNSSHSYQDPGERPEDTEETDTELIPATNYYYGIGWMVNDNLQLDFMGFNEITDMTNWRLSATLHFD
jgi:hypothetical protein